MAQSFEIELEHLINKHSLENETNTPDWILAQYIMACYKAYKQAVQEREEYFKAKEM